MRHSTTSTARASRPRNTILATLALLLVALAVTGFVIARAPVEEFTVDLGPVVLPAGASHHDVAQPKPRAVAIPVDGWYRGFYIEMVDGAGRPVPKQLLHHANLIAPERRELFSPIMLRLGAAGSETKPIKIPAVVGYRLHPGDSLLLTAMVSNPTSTSYDRAFVRVHLLYTPASQWLRPVGVYPFYLDVMPPAGIHEYALPPGHSEKSWEGRPTVPGRIVAVGGHLHRYSAALRFEDVTARRLLWEAKPSIGADGEVTHMPTKYFLPLGIHIQPDHVYRLTAVYDNPTGDTIPGGGMGALGGAFRPDDDAAWPKVDRESPVYTYDVEVTYRDHTNMPTNMPNMRMPHTTEPAVPMTRDSAPDRGHGARGARPHSH